MEVGERPRPNFRLPLLESLEWVQHEAEPQKPAATEAMQVAVAGTRKDEEALEEEDGNITAVYWPRLPAISPGWKADRRLSSILLPCRRSERLDGRFRPVDGSVESVDDSPEEGNLLTEGEPPQRTGTTGCLIYLR